MKLPAFKKGQIVWAKVRGYPWWPAMVNENSQKKSGAAEKNITVTFFAENKLGIVPSHKVLDYEANFEKLSLIKNKKLQEAIKIALEVYGVPKSTKDIEDPEKNADTKLSEDLEDLQTMEEEEEKNLGEEILNENIAEIAYNEKDNIIEISLKHSNDTLIKNEKILEEEEDDDDDDDDDIQVMRPKKQEPKAKKEKESLTKLEQKQKIKEEEKQVKYQDAIDLLQRRSTRSQAKTENIEMFTEPLIYSHRKAKKREKSSNDNDSVIDEIENHKLQSSPDSSNKASIKEPERSPEERKIEKNNEQEIKTKGTKTNLGKRPLVIKEEKEKKSVSKGKASAEDKKSSEKAKESSKKVKVARQTKESTSSSFNSIANNENKADHSAESLNQSTSGNMETILPNFSHPPTKHSKNLEVKHVQVVSHTQTNDAFLRKNVCQKLAKLLEEGYALNKDSSQELTLFIEGRINSYFLEDINYYKKVMKILYKLMKARMLKLEELRSIIKLEYAEFKSWLQGKIETAISVQEETVKSPSNQNLRKSSNSPDENSKNENLDIEVQTKHENSVIAQDEA